MEFPQKTIASVAPSMTPPQKPGGIVGASWSFASAGGVVTTSDWIGQAPQLPGDPLF